MPPELIAARIAAMRAASAERHVVLERARAAIRGLEIFEFLNDLKRIRLKEGTCPDCAAERHAGYLAGATSAPLREPAVRPCRKHREARRELLP